jgi:hypothetical protein
MEESYRAASRIAAWGSADGEERSRKQEAGSRKEEAGGSVSRLRQEP